MAYDLSLIAKRPKGSVVLLPEIEPGLVFERQLLRALRRLLKVIRQHTLEEILPMTLREQAAFRRALTGDADTDYERFRLLAQAMAKAVNEAVERVLQLQAADHTKQWFNSVKKALSVDVSAVVAEEGLEEVLRQAATRNAGLIRGLSDTMVNRIQNTTQRAITNGTPASELRQTLIKDFGFGEGRARVIARDQVAKLNSDLNRYRQQQAGVKKYVWRTAMDERVRQLHRSLSGKVYRYGEATGAEGGLPPGQPIQCRCVAQGIVEF